MKKLIVFFILFVFLLPFNGCAKPTYELAWDGFCYTAEEYEQPVELDPKDKNYIIGILNDATWVNDLAKCPADFVFVTQKQRVNYNCECGVFNDITRGRSTTVSEEQRVTINNILKGNSPTAEK